MFPKAAYFIQEKTKNKKNALLKIQRVFSEPYNHCLPFALPHLRPASAARKHGFSTRPVQLETVFSERQLRLVYLRRTDARHQFSVYQYQPVAVQKRSRPGPGRLFVIAQIFPGTGIRIV